MHTLSSLAAQSSAESNIVTFMKERKWEDSLIIAAVHCHTLLARFISSITNKYIRDRSLFMAGRGSCSNDFFQENLSRPTHHAMDNFRGPLVIPRQFLDGHSFGMTPTQAIRDHIKLYTHLKCTESISMLISNEGYDNKGP